MYPEWGCAGLLMFYSTDRTNGWRGASAYAAKILAGAKPAPISRSSRRANSPASSTSDRQGAWLPCAPQPYWGKPAVRNDRADRGNVGIIRSPVRASIPPVSHYRTLGRIASEAGCSISLTHSRVTSVIISARNRFRRSSNYLEQREQS